MQTGNTLYLDPKNNREYYSESDGNFMPFEQSLKAHTVLQRVAWMRSWVHELGSESHIDIGCKDGYTCLTLQAEGIDCVGIDPSSDSIEQARLKAQQARLDVTYLEGFGEDIPEGIFADTLSIMEVIEHVVDPRRLLERATKCAMYVLITTPDANGRHGMIDAERNPEHVRLYTKEELEKLCEEFGEVKECTIIDDQICIIFKTKK